MPKPGSGSRPKPRSASPEAAPKRAVKRGEPERSFEKTPSLRREAGLVRLEGLLAALRDIEGLREDRPGVFGHRSRAFLHFHYRPDGSIAADVRLSGDDFTRVDVSDESGQRKLLESIRRFVGE